MNLPDARFVRCAEPAAGATFDPAAIKPVKGLDLSDLGNSERFVARCGMHLDRSIFKLLPEFDLDLNEYGNWLWWDENLNRWRLKRSRRPRSFAQKLVGNGGHLVCEGYEVVKPKGYFKRSAAVAFGTHHHDVIDTFDISLSKSNIVVWPDLQCFHNISLSDGLVPLPSATDAGGASSAASKDGVS